MKFYAFHATKLWGDGELRFVVGITGGRVNYLPEAKYLYSVRLLLGVFKLEVLWTTLLSESPVKCSRK